MPARPHLRLLLRHQAAVAASSLPPPRPHFRASTIAELKPAAAAALGSTRWEHVSGVSMEISCRRQSALPALVRVGTKVAEAGTERRRGISGPQRASGVAVETGRRRGLSCQSAGHAPVRRGRLKLMPSNERWESSLRSKFAIGLNPTATSEGGFLPITRVEGVGFASGMGEQTQPWPWWPPSALPELGS